MLPWTPAGNKRKPGVSGSWRIPSGQIAGSSGRRHQRAKPRGALGAALAVEGLREPIGRQRQCRTEKQRLSKTIRRGRRISRLQLQSSKIYEDDEIARLDAQRRLERPPRVPAVTEGPVQRCRKIERVRVARIERDQSIGMLHGARDVSAQTCNRRLAVQGDSAVCRRPLDDAQQLLESGGVTLIGVDRGKLLERGNALRIAQRGLPRRHARIGQTALG